MNNDLFKTQEEIDSAIADFGNLLDSPGWKLFCKIVDANIEILRNQILDGSENDTKEQIDRLRDRLKVSQEIKNTPEMMIQKLQSPEIIPINNDPFYGSKEEIDKDLTKEEKTDTI